MCSVFGTYGWRTKVWQSHYNLILNTSIWHSARKFCRNGPFLKQSFYIHRFARKQVIYSWHPESTTSRMKGHYSQQSNTFPTDIWSDCRIPREAKFSLQLCQSSFTVPPPLRRIRLCSNLHQETVFWPWTASLSLPSQTKGNRWAQARSYLKKLRSPREPPFLLISHFPMNRGFL